jgi:hypothetical protein
VPPAAASRARHISRRVIRYSFASPVKRAFTGHRSWPPAWRSPPPKPSYDVIVIGGGGHGLATAHYLAKHYSISRVAVLEKGWLACNGIDCEIIDRDDVERVLPYLNLSDGAPY